MSFENHLNNVLNIYKEAKKQALNDIGNFVTTDAVLRAFSKGLNMADSILFDVVDENEVDIGITQDSSVNSGNDSSEQQGQSFIEPAVMENIDRLQSIAQESIKIDMGGDQ